MTKPSKTTRHIGSSGRSLDDRAVPVAGGAPPAWVAAVAIAISIGAVYGRYIDVPFIFDDMSTIIKNESIRSLWPLVGSEPERGPLNPAAELPTAARPLVNLSFAINYYFGGADPAGYHGVNVVLHFLSALLVWAIVQRILRLPYFAGKFSSSSAWLALVVALLWALHPLQTEAVIYATQRTELMMAFFYLATLYCSLRYWESFSFGWLLMAVLTCLCGMASKEVMVSAPLMVLLFERTFVAGSLANAMRRSTPLYIGLAATWILLLALGWGAPHKAAAGFGLGVSVFTWWITQCKVLLLYLKLVVWPWPLFIHYQFPYLTTVSEAWIYVAPVLLLGITTLALLWRNHPVGYLGTWVFVILSPTSVVPIITEMAAERRMYLPLAALVVLFVIGGYVVTLKLLARRDSDRHLLRNTTLQRFITVSPTLVIVTTFALVSAKRLTAYCDEISLWQEVVRDQKMNSLAHYNLGQLLMESGQLPEAIDELQAALAVKPDYTDVFNVLGLAHTKAGDLPKAVEALQAALEQKPKFVAAIHNLGVAYVYSGNFPRAIEQLEHAKQLDPDNAAILNHLAVALTAVGRFREAIEHLQLAVARKPDFADAYSNMGIALYREGKTSQAISQFQRAIELDKTNYDFECNLGNALVGEGNVHEAIRHFERAIDLQPGFFDAHYKIGHAFEKIGETEKAIDHYKTAIRLKPDFVQVYGNLAQTLNLAKRSDEAIAIAERGLEAARSAGNEVVAGQLEEWLTHYRIELKRSAEAADSQSPPDSQ